MDKQSDGGLVPVNDEVHLSDTEKSLLILDDMVLFQIMTNLSLVDLSHLIGTCKRMEKLVSEHLRKHHSNVHWRNYKNTNSADTIQPCDSERVFRTIGKYVKTVRLSLWVDFEFYEILVLLAHECPDIETLVLEKIRMTRPLLLADPVIKLMLGKLKRFVLNGCVWQGWCPLDTLFGENTTLEDLTVMNCCAHNRYNFRLQICGFRSLKKLRMTRCRNIVTEKELLLCFEQNNINWLALTEIDNVHIDNAIQSLTDTVDELSIDYSIITAPQLLSRLKQLTVIRLCCNIFTNIDETLLQIGGNCLIEELVVLRICVSSRTIDALKQFTNMKRLILVHIVNTVPRQFFRSLPSILPQLNQFVYKHSSIRDEDILYMFQWMPKLTRLNFTGCNSLATKTYSKIADMIESDWHRPKLELVLPRWETTEVTEVVKKATKKIWLRVEASLRPVQRYV